MPDPIAIVWPYIVTATHIALAAWTTIDCVQRKADSRAAVGWTAIAWLSPIIGSLLYWLLGINRIRRKATRLELSAVWSHSRHPALNIAEAEKAMHFEAEHPYMAGAVRLLDRVSQREATPGNAVALLRDGDEAYPAMLAAIAEAKDSVHLLSYIFDFDAAGEPFVDALEAAHRRGVQVRVLVDDVGSRYGKPNIVGVLRRRGVPVAAFLKTRRLALLNYANMRNHRKILVVDGVIGFTGGTNIRVGHWLAQEPEFPVRCLHFSFRGPVVAHLQETFAVDWAFATEEQVAGRRYFPRPEHHGEVWARGITGGPDEDLGSLGMVLFTALNSAKDRARIITPYFLPDQPLIQALIAAALRGVEVEVVLPAKNNIRLVQWAAMPTVRHLVRHGVRVYLSPAPFDHTKVFVIDDIWTLMGSTNWDPRSLRLNFEFNVSCAHRALASALHTTIDARIEEATPVTRAWLEARPRWHWVRDGLARLLSPYL